MRTHSYLLRSTVLALALMVAALLPSNAAMAHCDSMDGPVVKDAQRALAEKNLTPVLKWVRAEDEATVRTAFEATLQVRGESETAKDLADRYFFETLVRLHRAGEGEGFTGLKPTGSVDAAIAATDSALEGGNIDQLADNYAAAVRDAIKHRFSEAHEKRQAAGRSVAHGREYVEAYVQLTHFVESVDHLVRMGPATNIKTGAKHNGDRRAFRLHRTSSRGARSRSPAGSNSGSKMADRMTVSRALAGPGRVGRRMEVRSWFPREWLSLLCQILVSEPAERGMRSQP